MRSLFKTREPVDDGDILLRPPFRSVYFIITSAMGLGCVALDGYILHTYWQHLSRMSIVGLAVLVGLQMLYQWIRVFRLISVIKEFYTIASDDNLAPESPLGNAIQMAVAGFVDVLFFSYGITLVLLFVVWKLLSVLHPA